MRLKVTTSTSLVTVPPRFPFQIGAIKSGRICQSSHNLREFPFQIGAIKSQRTNLQKPAELRFHSRLVRLKGDDDEYEGGSEVLFPFQIGAIKRIKHPTFERASKKFPFQIGAIKSERGKLTPAQKEWFPFQIGAIKSCSFVVIIAIVPIVSIPDWCD